MTPCICRTGSGYWARAHIRLLTEEEEARAADVAARRQASSTKGNLTDYLGQRDPANDLLGARAELAVAIALGIEWPASVNTFTHEPDLPPDIEVRAARKTFLKIRPKEVASPRLRDRRYALVTPGRADYVSEYQAGASFVLWGFLRPREVVGEPLSDPGDLNRPAYFIRADRLHLFPLDMPHREPKIEPAKGKLVKTDAGFEYAP